MSGRAKSVKGVELLRSGLPRERYGVDAAEMMRYGYRKVYQGGSGDGFWVPGFPPLDAEGRQEVPGREGEVSAAECEAGR
jgi:hypothetical protein